MTAYLDKDVICSTFQGYIQIYYLEEEISSSRIHLLYIITIIDAKIEEFIN